MHAMGNLENTCRVPLVDDQVPMRLLLAQFISQDLGARSIYPHDFLRTQK